MSHLRDPFVDALADPKVIQTISASPDIKVYIDEDPDFRPILERLHDRAKRLLKSPTDIDWIEMGHRSATEAVADPRVMQAIMSLCGKPPKVGEDVDERPPEPLQEKHLRAIADIDIPEIAKEKGNDYVKSGDFAMALAHYQRGICLVRVKNPPLPGYLLLSVALLNNSALCLLKLHFPDRAKSSTTLALRALDKAGAENAKGDAATFDRSKLYYRRALACEKMEEFSMGVDDLKRALKEVQRVGSGKSEENKLQIEIGRMQKLHNSQIADDKKRDSQRFFWDGYVKKDVVAEYEDANKWSNPISQETIAPRFAEDGKELHVDKWSDRFPSEETAGNQTGEASGEQASANAELPRPESTTDSLRGESFI